MRSSLALLFVLCMGLVHLYLVVPGDTFLGLGFDIAYSSVIPLTPTEAANSFSRPPLLLFNKSGIAVTYISGGSNDLSSTEYSSVTSISRAQSASLKVSINIIYFGFQASGSFADFSTQMTSKYQKVYLAEATVLSNSVSIQSAAVNPEFLYDYNQLPVDYLTNQLAYNNFIKKWGTHYIESCSLGGRMNFRLYTTKSAESYFHSHSVNAAIGASVGFGVQVGVTVGGGKTDSNYQAMTTQSTQSASYGYGGNSAFLGNYTLWAASVPAQPMPITMSLGSYLQFLPNGTRTNSLETALEQYVAGTLVGSRYLFEQVLDVSSTTVILASSGPNPPVQFRRVSGQPSIPLSFVANTYNDPYAVSACPANAMIFSFYSFTYYGTYYGYTCVQNPSILALSGCVTSTVYSFAFSAPNNAVITGISTAHIPAYQFTYCPLTEAVINPTLCVTNTADAGSYYVFFACQSNAVLTSVIQQGSTYQYTCCPLFEPGASTLVFNSFGDIVLPNSQNAQQFYSVTELLPDPSVADPVTLYGTDPLIQTPGGFQLLWAGEFYVWTPLCNTNYNAMGSVVTGSNIIPNTNSVICVHDRCSVACSQGNKLWSGVNPSGQPLTLYSTVSPTGDIALGTFAATTSPTGVVDPSQMNCLIRDCLKSDLNTTAARANISTYWKPVTMACDQNHHCQVFNSPPAAASSPSNVGLIVGLVLMFVVLLVAVVVVLFFLYRRRQRLARAQLSNDLSETPSRSSGRNPFSVDSGVLADKKADKGISAPTGVFKKTTVQVGPNGEFVIVKAPTEAAAVATPVAPAPWVGANVKALYNDGNYYPGVVAKLRGNESLVRWTEFTTENWIHNDYVQIQE